MLGNCRSNVLAASALMIAIAAVRLATVAGGAVDGWPAYGHDAGGMRFSPLTEIDRTSVARLEVAWTVHTGDASDGAHATPMTYRIGRAGRQYVVVAAGGHAKITEEKLSDALVAFANRN